MRLSLVSPVSPKCVAMREQVSTSRFKAGLLLEAYRDRKEGWRHGDKVKEHFVECEYCLAWLGQQVDERFYIRAKNAAEYCCLSMYMAVEETDAGKEVVAGTFKERVRFSLWRGEDPRWTIGLNGCDISHCPWCGKRLPNSAFRSADPTVGGGPSAA